MHRAAHGGMARSRCDLGAPITLREPVRQITHVVRRVGLCCPRGVLLARRCAVDTLPQDAVLGHLPTREMHGTAYARNLMITDRMIESITSAFAPIARAAGATVRRSARCAGRAQRTRSSIPVIFGWRSIPAEYGRWRATWRGEGGAWYGMYTTAGCLSTSRHAYSS